MGVMRRLCFIIYRNFCHGESNFLLKTIKRTDIFKRKINAALEINANEVKNGMLNGLIYA
jgi:hypothetical protein